MKEYAHFFDLTKFVYEKLESKIARQYVAYVYYSAGVRSVFEVNELFALFEKIGENEFGGIAEIMKLTKNVGGFIEIENMAKYDTVFRVVKKFGFSGDFDTLLVDMANANFEFSSFDQNQLGEARSESGFSLSVRTIIQWASRLVQGTGRHSKLQLNPSVPTKIKINDIKMNLL